MDLLKRLREHAYTGCGDAHTTCVEAADEIGRLRAALKEIGDMGPHTAALSAPTVAKYAIQQKPSE